MSPATLISQQMQRLWQFLGFFQPPFLRGLHAVIVLLVAVQLLASSGMSSHAKPGSVSAFAGALHMNLGLALLPLTLFFIAYCWGTRGLKRFYGYLWGETEQLRADIRESLRMRMVPPRPGGLATAVQGLGFGALFLAAASGALWFTSVRLGWPSTHAFKGMHEFCGSLVVLYLMGHGGMALLHFNAWQRDVLEKQEHSRK